jgi:two-component system sensor histidine kinase TctE
MHAAVKALQHLITQLISLAKADRPENSDDGAGYFDLIDCTTATARTYASQALAKTMEISFESECEHLFVNGNATFATEVIANLLDNAIRYGEAGGHIIVRILEKDGILEIEDDGPGIPFEEQERVFERFYRLPRNLEREGSGLGLPIVRALGRRMGAVVSAGTPQSGKGFIVRVQFHLRPNRL